MRTPIALVASATSCVHAAVSCQPARADSDHAGDDHDDDGDGAPRQSAVVRRGSGATEEQRGRQPGGGRPPVGRYPPAGEPAGRKCRRRCIDDEECRQAGGHAGLLRNGEADRQDGHRSRTHREAARAQLTDPRWWTVQRELLPTQRRRRGQRVPSTRQAQRRPGIAVPAAQGPVRPWRRRQQPGCPGGGRPAGRRLPPHTAATSSVQDNQPPSARAQRQRGEDKDPAAQVEHVSRADGDGENRTSSAATATATPATTTPSETSVAPSWWATPADA